ncbi:flavin monoamine oxidase family protein [Candidatus Protochlamydia sp. W-9]|uniref:flavin monoamine oxidase family protein n=1 Tax=Candidatus Protochlamydia sp. W-9 TaxID=1785087 RepID=UPI00096A5F0B|nr:FAD-dependent oxidoreductase [Candidatus Protochlamydia sp. W-9]
MAQTLLLALLLIFNQIHASISHQSDEYYEVIVIGAGISGLTAAMELKKSGMKVLVIEAAERIGGRLWTVNTWGTNLELGASWIHGIENNPVFDIVRDLREPIQPTIYNAKKPNCKLESISLYDSKGRKLSKSQFNEIKKLSLEFGIYIDKIESQNNPTKMSILDAFENFCKDSQIIGERKEQLYQLSRILYSNEYGAELKDIAILEYDYINEMEALGTNAIMACGYNLVTSKMAIDLPIELNCKVNQIIYDDKGVRCLTNKGSFVSQYAVVTVPLGVLKNKDITFNPCLPKEKIDAIDTLQMGLLNKVYLFFPYTFWDRSEWIVLLPSDESADMQFDIMNSQRYFKQPVLLGFVSGDYAKKLEAWSDEEIVDSYMKVLRKIYGTNIPSPSAHLITRWGQNPLFYGSYSFLPTSKSGDNPYKWMKVSVNNKVFFAGEASSQHEPSTVYGAFMRGQEVAKAILGLAGKEIQH